MKLELHLIPKTSYYINLRNYLGSGWKVISDSIRAKNDFTCQYCNLKKDPKNIHLHEVWEFSKETSVQKLVKFECICSTCHSIHHWGLSMIQGKNMPFLSKYACKINNCSIFEWNSYVEECFEEWKKRSEISWKVDVSYIDTFKVNFI